MQAVKAYQIRIGFLYPKLSLIWVLALGFIFSLNTFQAHTLYGQTNTIIEIDDIQPRMASPKPLVVWEGKGKLNETLVQKPVRPVRLKWYESIWEILHEWWRMNKGN